MVKAEIRMSRGKTNQLATDPRRRDERFCASCGVFLAESALPESRQSAFRRSFLWLAVTAVTGEKGHERYPVVAFAAELAAENIGHADF